MVQFHIGMTLEELEKEVILHALSFYNNNKTHTANALGVSIRTIQNKVAKYNGESIEEESTGLEETTGGLHVESTSKLSKKQRVSLREQEEV